MGLERSIEHRAQIRLRVCGSRAGIASRPYLVMPSPSALLWGYVQLFKPAFQSMSTKSNLMATIRQRLLPLPHHLNSCSRDRCNIPISSLPHFLLPFPFSSFFFLFLTVLLPLLTLLSNPRLMDGTHTTVERAAPSQVKILRLGISG